MVKMAVRPRRETVQYKQAASPSITCVKRAKHADGKGVFLVRGIPIGEGVLYMLSPRRVDTRRVGALLETRRQEADCAVHVP